MSDFTGNLIIQYLDNTLSESDEGLLLNWIKESEENREIFLTCKKIYALGKVKHYSDPLLLSQALEKFNLQVKSKQIQIRHDYVILLRKYAAILFFLLTIPALLWYMIHVQPVKMNTVNVDRVEPVKLVLLPDGSKVWINNNSSITYPVLFEKNERKVSIVGEAYFEVKTDSLHPFIVKTEAMQVKVYGTSFNVNTNTIDSTITTTLVTGHVAIRDAEGKNLVMLKPGQLACFHKTTNKMELHQVNTDLYTLWHKGLLVFDKKSLNDITAKIEDTYNVKITINQQNKIQNKINFVFRKTQPLDTVLEMLKFVTPIKYKKYGDQIYINLK